MNLKFKVAFVDFSNNFFDRHAIYSLSAYLKSNGIENYYINNKIFSKAISSIKEISADLLLYSAFSSDIPLYIEFDKIVKENLNIKSIIGGPGPTFDWNFLDSCTIDALCIGEGEDALVNYIKSGFSASKNIIANKDSMPSEFYPFMDLNNIPFPDRDFVYKNDYCLRNMPSKQFLAGRGCPYMCTYCHNNIQNRLFKKCGPIVRMKSVDYLIGEIKAIKSKYPLETAIFQDDTFILKKKWLFEFCERFPREVGIPYTCNIRANLIDEETIIALKESNCSCVYWSIESGNEDFRNRLLKRGMSAEQILETGRLLNKYKISHRNGGIIGLPGEKFEEMLETVDLNIKTKPVFGFASIFIPFPGLELTNYALEHGHISEETLKDLPKNMHIHSVLNFTDDMRLKIQKLTYLYPIFTSFPKLFYNRTIFNLLFRLPKALLYAVFNLFTLYKMSRLYRVNVPLPLRIAIMLRYLKNPY